MKALVVGRHNTNIKGVDVVEIRAVTFPRTAEECGDVILKLFEDADKLNAKLLFQNVPGQVAVALGQLFIADVIVPGQGGIIISKVGERPADIVKVFRVSSEADATILEEAVKFANPRAKTKVVVEPFGVYVTCTPPMVFEFSHVEWF